MKKSIFILAVISITTTAHSQFNTPWKEDVNNSLQNGYIGIGTSPTANTNVLKPNFNFQVHGVSKYTFTVPAGPIPIGGVGSNGHSKDYGISSRIGITNKITGQNDTDGGLIMMTKNDLIFKNQEAGKLQFLVPGLGMTFSSSTRRIFIGQSPSSSQDFAKFTVVTSDNGLSVKTNVTSKYALRLKVPDDKSNLIEAYGSNNTRANFRVSGAGDVYARRYITTLQPFPDYVFQPDYKLRTFAELRNFITTYKHLPNMPTAIDVEKNGADIGEINRVLVEKVEELTLYILELEERMVKIESDNNRIDNSSTLTE